MREDTGEGGVRGRGPEHGAREVQGTRARPSQGAEGAHWKGSEDGEKGKGRRRKRRVVSSVNRTGVGGGGAGDRQP